MKKKWTQLKNGDLAQQAEEVLTQHIVSGELSPGSYLPPEQELCQKLGIGRSTLREAVSVLQSKGLVERRHGVGVRVIDQSQQAASQMLQLMLRRQRASDGDLLEMRRLYESQAAAWAAERATATDLKTIRATLDGMHAAKDTPEEYARMDLDFHRAVAASTHNEVLRLFVETIRTLLHDAILANLKTDFRPDRTLQYHEQVFDAIQRKDADEASRAMAQHLDDAEEMMDRTGDGA